VNADKQYRICLGHSFDFIVPKILSGFMALFVRPHGENQGQLINRPDPRPRESGRYMPEEKGQNGRVLKEFTDLAKVVVTFR